MGRHPLGPRVRPGAHHQRHAAPPLLRGDGRVPHAGDVQHQRHLADRAHDHSVGHRRAEGAVAAVHPRARGALGPGLQRAYGRTRPPQPSAHLATWGLFLLRTDPTAIERGKKHEGITAFILNLKTPGIDVRPIRDMAGEELFNEIFFTDVRIPAKWRLGDEGAGWMVSMGTLGFKIVGIASHIAILAADLRAMVAAARSVNPGALDDPSLRDRIAKGWTEIELARLLSLRALSKIMKGEKNWPEVPFAKLSWSSMAQTLAELAVDLLGPSGALAKGGPDAVDRGKWTRLYAFQRYSTIGGGSTEIQKNIIADRAIAMPGKSRG